MSLQDDLNVLNMHLNALLREADITPASQGMRSSIADIRNHVQIMIANNPSQTESAADEDLDGVEGVVTETSDTPDANDEVESPAQVPLNAKDSVDETGSPTEDEHPVSEEDDDSNTGGGVNDEPKDENSDGETL